MATKFVRGLFYPNILLGATVSAAFHLKCIYEFWSFCINGGSDPLIAGGAATTTPTNLPGMFLSSQPATTIAAGSNGLTLPQSTINVVSTTGFTSNDSWVFVTTSNGVQKVKYAGISGTSFTGCTGGTGTMTTGNTAISGSLLASGSDGVTNATVSTTLSGEAIFTSASANFNTHMVGQILVMWKPGSNSSEDSMYLITERISSTQIKININSGGFPDATTLHPAISSRSSIRYRVIDPQIATSTVDTSGTAGQYFVTQFNSTGINSGQANPQVQFIKASSGDTVSVVLSGTGSWNGSAFINDGYTTSIINALSTSNPHSISATVTINMVGDIDFLLAHTTSASASTNSTHIEIPNRLYPEQNDLHPITVMMGGFSSHLASNITSQNYGGGFYMKTHSTDILTANTSTRLHRVLVKATSGDGTAAIASGSERVFGQSMNDARIGFNTITGTVLTSEALLCLPGVPNQFSLARCKLRKVKFAGIHLPPNHRIGINGEFIHIRNGICWPWDNTILPHNPFLLGYA